MNFAILQRETIYQGRAFEVEKVHLRLPDGTVRPYDLVQHSGSVTIVPLDAQGNILFVKQYRIGVGEALLELPAGVLNDGEDPQTCAAREIREETGLAAEKLELLGDFYLAPGYSSEHMYIFLASGLYPSPLEQDADEFLQLITIPASQALEMAQSGQLRDAKSLAALMLAQKRLKGNL
ncbi:MAG: ADP-ribose pyrophosphatase [Bellilinea sp.]|nr:MAG: ADP-ribose pyrophosphatase [Bellilinea sp.]